MGEPGGLPSMGSHRVGHDWRDLAVAAAGASFAVYLHILLRKDWCLLFMCLALCWGSWGDPTYKTRFSVLRSFSIWVQKSDTHTHSLHRKCPAGDLQGNRCSGRWIFRFHPHHSFSSSACVKEQPFWSLPPSSHVYRVAQSYLVCLTVDTFFIITSICSKAFPSILHDCPISSSWFLRLYLIHLLFFLLSSSSVCYRYSNVQALLLLFLLLEMPYFSCLPFL